MLSLFYLLPSVLLYIPAVQKEVAHAATRILKDELGTDVAIGSVEMEPFNKVILKNLYLADQEGDTLFYAQRLSAGFEVLPLLQGKLKFSSAQLFSFQVNLNKEEDDAPLNIQFLVDLFAKEDTLKKESAIDLNIHTLNIRRGTFTYRVKSAEKTIGRFNAKDLNVRDVSAKLRLHKLTNDSINIEFNRLALKDHSGLEVKRLQFDVAGSRQQLQVTNFNLWLPQSHVQLGPVLVTIPPETTGQEGGGNIADASFMFDIAKTEITPKDISAIVVGLSNFRDKITLHGQVKGTLNQISVTDFEMYVRNHLSMQINMFFSNLTSAESAYLEGDLNRFFITPEGVRVVAENFSPKEITFPPQIEKLGNIGFSGHVSGHLRDLIASGDFSTGSGDLRIDVNVGRNKEEHLFIKGMLKTKEFDIYSLFPEQNPYGKVAFEIDVDAKQDKNENVTGVINAIVNEFDFKEHHYKNINFKGDFTQSSFNGVVVVDDDYGKLSAEGFVKINGKQSEYDFSAQAVAIQLGQLNLSNKYEDADVSFSIDARMTGSSIDEMFGYLSLKDLHFRDTKEEFTLDSLTVDVSSQSGEDRLIRIQSDILQGEIGGEYSYKDLFAAIKETMHPYLPAVIPPAGKRISENNNIYMHLTVKDTEHLSRIFKLPFTLNEESRFSGQYNQLEGSFHFEASLPKYRIGNSKMENTTLLFQNPQDKAELEVCGIRYGKFDVKTDFNIRLAAQDNVLDNLLSWRNQEEALYEGELISSVLFSPGKGNAPVRAEIQIKPTHLVFNDTVWTMHSSKITIDERIVIDQLNVDHLNQYIKIAGAVSKDTTDYLLVDLNEVNLDYIFNALNIPALEFGGLATGKIYASDVYASQKLTTDLRVKDFSFNQVTFGDLALSGLWDNDRKGIVMLGDIYKNDTTQVNIDGIIYPSTKELSIYFDAQNADARFLQKYLNNVAPGLKGDVSGRLCLHGSFKEITVSGNAFVRNGGFGIDFLNTYYTFSDSVYLTDNQIKITNTLLYDKFGEVALANGSVIHNFFDTFDFNAQIQTNNFLVFSGTERQNPFFYGNAFGSGTATIYGTEKDVNIDISMRTEEKTKISLNFMETSDVMDFDFINFVSKKDTLSKPDHNLSALSSPNTNSMKANIKMDLSLEATPNALVEFYLDPVSGDRIKAWGKGKMQIQYGTQTDPRIYGTYTLERGNYNFSLQQVIFKDFYIKDGSSIAFHGDPYAANLNIDALYSLSANLADLDPSFDMSATLMSTVTVNCLLNISGELEQPAIKFDLELPNSSNELQRQVKSVISTNEMMNRQMIFLLALGRFYTQENIATPVQNNSNNLASVASSTLSSQLNNILGDLSETIQIGTNIRTNNMDDYTDTEVKLLLSSQLLNNRLLINGNFGYKENPTVHRTFIGDFDLEYKLTKSGDIRLKAYSHYNDRYYYNIERALTTQGVGILFRRDFDNLYDFFKIKKRKPEDDFVLVEETPLAERDFVHFKQSMK